MAYSCLPQKVVSSSQVRLLLRAFSPSLSTFFLFSPRACLGLFFCIASMERSRHRRVDLRRASFPEGEAVPRWASAEGDVLLFPGNSVFLSHVVFPSILSLISLSLPPTSISLRPRIKQHTAALGKDVCTTVYLHCLHLYTQR